MGCQATRDGICVQFYDKAGAADGVPVFGKYAVLFGRKREDILAEVPAGPRETDLGSDDWLTLIAVADSQEKLKEIIKDLGGSCPIPQTSGSSRRAVVALHLGGMKQKFRDRITIASGPILSLKPPKVDVVHVKVLPPDTKMDESHPLFPEWKGTATTLLNQ